MKPFDILDALSDLPEEYTAYAARDHASHKTAEQDKAVVDNLERVAREHGRTMAQESLAWMLSKPFICSPVVGTTSVKHVEEAVSAVDIEITPEEVAALEAPYTAHTKQHAF